MHIHVQVLFTLHKKFELIRIKIAFFMNFQSVLKNLPKHPPYTIAVLLCFLPSGASDSITKIGDTNKIVWINDDTATIIITDDKVIF